MTKFNEINTLWDFQNTAAISRMVSSLDKEMATCAYDRRYKYLELIHYCNYLNADMKKKKQFGAWVIRQLDTSHELGRNIQKKIEEIQEQLSPLF